MLLDKSLIVELHIEAPNDFTTVPQTDPKVCTLQLREPFNRWRRNNTIDRIRNHCARRLWHPTGRGRP